MKQIIKPYNVVALAFVLLVSFKSYAAGDEPGIEKKKSYSKSYNVSSNDKISLNNSFGSFKLETWDKNEVKVDVEITVRATTEERAQKLLDAITIEDGKDGEGVHFKTDIKNHGNDNWNDNDNDKDKDKDRSRDRDNDRSKDKDKDKNKDKEHNRNHSTNIKINYVVHAPANNTLTISNQFGPTTLPDYSGPLDVTSKFGSLTAGKLAKVKNLVVEFGKADIQSINDCHFVIKFSKFTINKISGDIDAKFEFCDKVELSLDNTLKKLTLHNSYSKIDLSTTSDLSASFDIQTHFGQFANKSTFSIKEEAEVKDEWRTPRFDYHFTGQAGSGSTKITIKSNFGETRIK